MKHTCQPADDSTSYQLGHAVCAALDHRTDDPNRRCYHQGQSTTQIVRNKPSHDGSGKRAGRHGRRDTALQVRVGMIEVLQILVGPDPGTHRAHIKTKQGTANGAKGRQDCEASVTCYRMQNGRRTIDVGNAIHNCCSTSSVSMRTEIYKAQSCHSVRLYRNAEVLWGSGGIETWGKNQDDDPEPVGYLR